MKDKEISVGLVLLSPKSAIENALMILKRRFKDLSMKLNCVLKILHTTPTYFYPTDRFKSSKG
jgi:hypothetical protein